MPTPAARATRESIIGDPERDHAKNQRQADKIERVQIEQPREQAERDQRCERGRRDQESKRAREHLVAVVGAQVATLGKEAQEWTAEH